MAFVEDHAWTFAKTMPHIPHEYVVRGKNGCDDDDWDVRGLHQGSRIRGSVDSPKRATMDNVYLELGVLKFWVIFPVINRERIENSTTQRIDQPPRGSRTWSG